ncbi:MAG: sulfite exporter TauE/SafE family protein [Chitinivibrionia bacterium]|nr:sulfite exporter TauE/SafE family protein [Chitinivibrionia bacterium]
MYFPVAGIEVNPLVPPLVAFVISFFTSMGGVSGAFLILPFQVSVLGFTTPAVSATNQLYNIVAIPSGVFRYVQERRMVWPLTWVIVAATIPGIMIGALLRIRYLPDPKNFKLFAGFVLLYIGIRLLRDQLRKRSALNKVSVEEQFQKSARESKKRRNAGAGGDSGRLAGITVKKFTVYRIRYEFHGTDFEVTTPAVMALSLAVGIVGGVYGIGGGAIIAPFLVSIFGLPVYTVAGAALMGTFVSSIAGVLFYRFLAALHPSMPIAPDWTLGVLFGIGGFAGMYCGARLQKYMPARIIKWMLAACILFLAVKYIVDFF